MKAKIDRATWIMVGLTVVVCTAGILIGSPAYACNGSTMMSSSSMNYPIYYRFYNLDQGTAYEFELQNPSSGSDSVMRLFKRDLNDSGYHEATTEVAVNDDGGVGYASKINHTPAQSGSYVLVIHGYYTGGLGTGDLWFNGAEDVAGITFGGVSANTCALDHDDKIHTMFELGGALNHQLLVVDGYPASPGHFYGSDTSSLGWRSVNYSHSSSSGDDDVLLVVGSADAYSGIVGWTWNDASNDSDGDGLGDTLEDEIGTCPDTATVTGDGWDCSYFTPQDTDNDGLSDTEELLGFTERRFVSLPWGGGWYVWQSIPFRLWGADPLQKDVYVEVDYDSNNFGGSPDLADEMTDQEYNKLYQLFQAGESTDLHNPNGADGLRVHFDVEGISQYDQPGNPALLFNGNGSGQTLNGASCSGKNYIDRRVDSMHSTRQERFRYMCAFESGGGQSGGEPHLAFKANASSAYITAHEVGHNIGVKHGGFEALNGKPNYISNMNYAFQGARLKGSRSPQFSQGELPTLNDVSLCEAYGVGPSEPVDHLDRDLSAAHKFKVDNTNFQVDWNRDGDFDDCSSPVRAAATWATWASPAAHTQGTDSLSPGANLVSNAPTLARVDAGGNSYLHVIYPTGGTSDHMRYQFTDFAADCPNSNHLTSGSCGNWSTDYSTSWYGEAVTATTFTLDDGNTYVFLAVRRPNDELHIFRGTPATNGTLSFTRIKQFSGSSVAGTPDIEAHDDKLQIVWREDDGTDEIYYAHMSDSGVWTGPLNTYWTSNTSPTLARNPANSNLYLLRTDSSDQLQFLWLSGSSSWSSSSTYALPLNSSYRTKEKPAVVWHPFDMVADAQGDGYWAIAFEHYTKGFMELLYFDGSDLEVLGKFRSSWYKKAGFDMLYHPDDDNLHAVAYDEETDGSGTVTNTTLRFHPYADGIFDYDLEDFNDFSGMAIGICKGFDDVLGDDRCGGPSAITPIGIEYDHGECDLEP